jgi:hypothetical protein
MPRAARTRRRSEITSEGKRITRLDSILLNGNNVALVRPPACPHAPAFPPPSPASARPWPQGPGLTSHHARVKRLGDASAVILTLTARVAARAWRRPELHCEVGAPSEHCARRLGVQTFSCALPSLTLSHSADRSTPSRYRTLARTSAGFAFCETSRKSVRKRRPIGFVFYYRIVYLSPTPGPPFSESHSQTQSRAARGRGTRKKPISQYIQFIITRPARDREALHALSVSRLTQRDHSRVACMCARVLWEPRALYFIC